MGVRSCWIYEGGVSTAPLSCGYSDRQSNALFLGRRRQMKKYPKAVLSFITGPIRTDHANFDHSGRLVLTHLQKYSHFGFMLTWPFCLHFWWMWDLQEGSEDEGWKPGTEQGIYFRTPGYRFDSDLGMKWTWGYLGLHWD